MNSKCSPNKLAVMQILILVIFISNNLVLTENNSLTQISYSDGLYTVPSQSSSNPPIIEWPHSPANATYIPAICWDGAYTGQTQEVWTWTHWVNDTDGVDTVLFRFLWHYEDEWFNRSTVRIAGDTTNGRYSGNLTWGVVWNWQNGYPEWVNGSGTFWFKVWANDTFGNWNETPPLHYMGGYMIVNPPPLHWALFIGQLLVVPAIVVVVLVIIWKKRKA